MYLGLVLAGATPQVLAQAATAKRFSVKDKVTAKNDLNKNPNPADKDFAYDIHEYFRDLETLLGDLKKLYSIEEFDPDHDSITSSHISYSPCPPTGIFERREIKSNFDPWLFGALNRANYADYNFRGLADCLSYRGFKAAQSAGFSVSYDTSEFKYQIFSRLGSLAKTEALYERLTDALNLFQADRSDEDDIRIKVLREHTLLSKADNQVLITTRLPRSALDPLLASDAK